MVLKKLVRAISNTVNSPKADAPSITFKSLPDPFTGPALLCPPFAVKDDIGKRNAQEDCWQAVPELVTVPASALSTSSSASSSDSMRDSAGEVDKLPNLKSSTLRQSLTTIGTRQTLHFFAVYDGHGGAEVSRHCARVLHTHLHAELTKKRSVRSISDLQESAAASEYGLPQALEDPVTSAFKEAYRLTDKEVASSGSGRMSGSTAVSVLLGQNCIWVANCGDSRAVVVRDTDSAPLSDDHKAYHPDEVERIKRLGGCIRNGRVMGELAISRAIGDLSLRPYVTAEPEVTCYYREAVHDQLLIIASDGLWDVLTNDCVNRIALKAFRGQMGKGLGRKKACSKTASTLIKEALKAGTQDNVTVIVVDVRQ